MSTSRPQSYHVSPFTAAVVSSMRALYPEALADKSFDNTGLLIEAPLIAAHPRNRNSVLLTIDLTRAVAEEAIEGRHSVVVAYHPIIFRGLKAITTDDTQQLSMTVLLAHGISVYCPHTAVDVVPDGMADWLCDVVTGKLDEPELHTHTPTTRSPPSEVKLTTSGDGERGADAGTRSASSTKPASTPDDVVSENLSDPFTTPTVRNREQRSPGASDGHPQGTYSQPAYPQPTTSFHAAAIPHSRSVITPSPGAALDAANQLTASSAFNASNTGAGRLIEFERPQPLSLLITRIAHAIGLPKGFAVAIPQGESIESISISKVATCPGSGGGVVRGCRADLIFTGELSHHEALAVTERGGCVITLFHSNSERGYLWGVMREKLERAVKAEWKRMQKEKPSKSGTPTPLTEMLQDDSVEVVVSQRDRDPYGIVVLNETAVHGVDLAADR